MNMQPRLFAVLAVALLNCTPNGASQETPSYHSERGGFAVSLPADWERNEEEMGQDVWGVVALSPEEGANDFFSENVNIVPVPADTNDLSEANRRGIDVLKQNTEQFTLLDQAVGKIGKHPASWFVYTCSYEGHTLRVVKYTLIHGSKMYLVTGTALPETFDQSRPVFEKIVASMVFDEPATPGPSPDAPPSSKGNAGNVAGRLGAAIGAIVGFYALFRACTRKK